MLQTYNYYQGLLTNGFCHRNLSLYNWPPRTSQLVWRFGIIFFTILVKRTFSPWLVICWHGLPPEWSTIKCAIPVAACFYKGKVSILTNTPVDHSKVEITQKGNNTHIGRWRIFAKTWEIALKIESRDHYGRDTQAAKPRNQKYAPSLR